MIFLFHILDVERRETMCGIPVVQTILLPKKISIILHCKKVHRRFQIEQNFSVWLAGYRCNQVAKEHGVVIARKRAGVVFSRKGVRVVTELAANKGTRARAREPTASLRDPLWNPPFCSNTCIGNYTCMSTIFTWREVPLLLQIGRTNHVQCKRKIERGSVDVDLKTTGVIVSHRIGWTYGASDIELQGVVRGDVGNGE